MQEYNLERNFSALLQYRPKLSGKLPRCSGNGRFELNYTYFLSLSKTRLINWTSVRNVELSQTFKWLSVCYTVAY